MIVNIRGTSGSGKSTIARELMGHKFDTIYNPHIDKQNEILGYRTEEGIYVVGRYTTQCGGCDTIKTQDKVCELVRKFSKEGPVVFEGLLISHLFSRYEALSTELGGIIFAFLDTPLDLCLERVRKRRQERGNLTPLNPTNTIQKFHDSIRVADKFRKAGHRVEIINHRDSPTQQIRNLLFPIDQL